MLSKSSSTYLPRYLPRENRKGLIGRICKRTKKSKRKMITGTINTEIGKFLCKHEYIHKRKNR